MIAERRGGGERAGHRVTSRTDHRGSGLREARVAWLGRLRDRAAGALFQARDHGRRICGLSAETAEHVQGVLEPGGVSHRRARRDEAGIVAHDIRDDQRIAGPLRARRQPAAFDGGEMLAHGVERVDVGARAKEPVGRRPLVVERDAIGRNGHQRRRASREQDEQPFTVARGRRQVRAPGVPRARSRGWGPDDRRQSTRTQPAPAPGRTRRQGRRAGVSRAAARRQRPSPARLFPRQHARSAGTRTVRPIGQRGIDERIRRSRSDAGPDNRQEIVSKIRE